jgi:hypothetical protein
VALSTSGASGIDSGLAGRGNNALAYEAIAAGDIYGFTEDLGDDTLQWRNPVAALGQRMPNAVVAATFETPKQIHGDLAILEGPDFDFLGFANFPADTKWYDAGEVAPDRVQPVKGDAAILEGPEFDFVGFAAFPPDTKWYDAGVVAPDRIQPQQGELPVLEGPEFDFVENADSAARIRWDKVSGVDAAAVEADRSAALAAAAVFAGAACPVRLRAGFKESGQLRENVAWRSADFSPRKGRSRRAD